VKRHNVPVELATTDWEEAFGIAEGPTAVEGEDGVSVEEFFREDVEEVIAMSEGENDGPDWLLVAKLKDGRFAFLEAGCDYTGWDCQASGAVVVSTTLERLIRFGIGDDQRERLRLSVTP